VFKQITIKFNFYVYHILLDAMYLAHQMQVVWLDKWKYCLRYES